MQDMVKINMFPEALVYAIDKAYNNINTPLLYLLSDLA